MVRYRYLQDSSRQPCVCFGFWQRRKPSWNAAPPPPPPSYTHTRTLFSLYTHAHAWFHCFVIFKCTEVLIHVSSSAAQSCSKWHSPETFPFTNSRRQAVKTIGLIMATQPRCCNSIRSGEKNKHSSRWHFGQMLRSCGERGLPENCHFFDTLNSIAN